MTIDKSASAIPANDKSHTRQRRLVKISGPASYATGGDPVSLDQLGLTQIHSWPGVSFSNGTVIIHSFYDATAKKLKFFVVAGTEVPNATNLSTYSAVVEVVGR